MKIQINFHFHKFLRFSSKLNLIQLKNQKKPRVFICNTWCLIKWQIQKYLPSLWISIKWNQHLFHKREQKKKVSSIRLSLIQGKKQLKEDYPLEWAKKVKETLIKINLFLKLISLKNLLKKILHWIKVIIPFWMKVRKELPFKFPKTVWETLMIYLDNLFLIKAIQRIYL